LWRACSDGDFAFVVSLLEGNNGRPLNLNWSDPDHDRTAFYRACSHGYLDIVQYLMKNPNIDPVKAQIQGATPFNIACQQGHAGVVKTLMNDPRIDVNSRDTRTRTPFFMAAKNGHVEVMKLLLQDERVDPNAVGHDNTTPFKMACLNGHYLAVELLLDDPRIDPNQPDVHNLTPLGAAVQNGHVDVVKLLLATVLTLSPFSATGKTLVEEALAFGEVAIAEVLEAYEARNSQTKFRLWRELHLQGDFP